METITCHYCGRPNQPGADECRDCGQPLTPGHEGGGHEASGPAAAGAGFVPPAQTYVPPFETAGDVLRPTFRLYKENFWLVAKIVLAVAVPLALVEYAAAETRSPALHYAYLLLNYLFGLLLNGALTYAVYAYAESGANPTLGEAYGAGLATWPKVLAVTLASSVIVAIGMMLLVIPGIIFSVMFALVVPLVVVGDRGIAASFTESAELTKGYRWQIFATYFVVGVIIFVLHLLAAGSLLGTAAGGRAGPLTVLVTITLHLIQSMLVVLAVFIYLGVHARRQQASPPVFAAGAER